MKAIIINCKQELQDAFTICPECTIFASNYITYLSLKNEGVEYLYDSNSNIPETPQDLEYLAMNWYRDKRGFDIFSKSEISFSTAITRRVYSSFANDYRNYYAIKYLLKSFDFIYIARNSDLSFIRTAAVFSRKIKWYDCADTYEYIDTSSPERTIIKNPSKKSIFLSKICYILQKIFFSFIKKNILVWNDWTYTEQFSDRNDCLISNYYLPWRAFYFPYGVIVEPESEVIFPDSISCDKLNNELIRDNLNNENYSWDEELVTLFVSTVNRVYQESYIVLRQTFSTYKALLSHYRPKTIILPGETHFAYVIAAQIARQLKIETVLIIDGYQVTKDRRIHYYDYMNSNLLFDKYVAFGEAHRQLYEKYQNIPVSQVVLAQSPLAVKLRLDNKTLSEYDAIVMAYNSDQLDPNQRWDQRYKITNDIVRLLYSLGLSRIAVKIKDGVNKEKEGRIYEKYCLHSNFAHKPEIIYGEFSKYLSNTKIVVGQATTSLFESACSKVPYIVYEPYESGVMDYELEESILINRESIARNTHELGEMIRKQETSVIVKHEDLTSGLPLRELRL